MKTVSNIFQSEFKEKGSKFLGFLFQCRSEDEFNDHIQEYKTKFWDASHHCYAYRIGPTNTIEYCSDDGEPSGTAGLPILNQLRSNELIDVGAVVIRYFGGTKLGKSGLIEAYGNGAQLSIESAKLLQIKLVQFVQISYPYSQENTVNKLIMDYSLIEQSAEYLTDVSKTFACPVERISDFRNGIASVEHLSIDHEMLYKSYIYV